MAARMEPRQVAKMADTDRIPVIKSRRHMGQLSGSLGSFEGWGTSMMPSDVVLRVEGKRVLAAL